MDCVKTLTPGLQCPKPFPVITGICYVHKPSETQNSQYNVLRLPSQSVKKYGT